MKIPRSFLFFVLYGLSVALAHAQDGTAERVPTVSRLVRVVVELEQDLFAKIRSGKPALVEQALADDFEMRVGFAPGIPVPRADWVSAAIARPDTVLQLTQIAVHEFGDLAIASFLLAGPRANQKHAGGDTFVVDVWKRTGESWKLATRYASPAGTPEFPIVGVSVPKVGAAPPVEPHRH